MKQIKNIRIDDRLIHGQIVSAWISYLNIKQIVIADDKAAADSLQQSLLKMATPKSVELKVMCFNDAVVFLEGIEDDNSILVICRNLDCLEKFMDAGANVETVNFGNCSTTKGAIRYSKALWLNEEQLNKAKQIMEKGVKLIAQVVPTEMATDFNDLIK